MRYELADHEWAAIKPLLPNKARGVPRVNDRRVLDGIFWVLRSGAPWRDLPESSGRSSLRQAANYLAFIRLASIRLWLRVNESTP
jgi:transposase